MQTLIDIDRYILAFFNGSPSLFLDNMAVVLTSGLTWIPLYMALLYMAIKNNETMKQVMLVIGCALLCIVLSDVVADFIVKPAVARYRPSYNPFIKYTVHIVDGMRSSGFSFFSAHAANTFCIAVFFSFLVRNMRLTIALVLWALVNCWTRMYLGLHYPSDIFVGILWGCIVGTAVYFIFLRLYLHARPDFNYVSSQYTATGYNQADVDIVLMVLTLTLLYAIISSLIF